MPAKPKTRRSSKAKGVMPNRKRQAVAKVFGNAHPALDDSESCLDFYYSRRGLTTVRDGRFLELKYVVEIDELEQVIQRTLALIQKRDGVKVFKEASRHLRNSIR
jgi:hypothetical protein